MRKLTGKMLHEAYSQADDVIIGKKYAKVGVMRSRIKAWEEILPISQDAYNRMAEILNEQQQSEVTLWDAEVVG